MTLEYTQFGLCLEVLVEEGFDYEVRKCKKKTLIIYLCLPSPLSWLVTQGLTQDLIDHWSDEHCQRASEIL